MPLPPSADGYRGHEAVRNYPKTMYELYQMPSTELFFSTFLSFTIFLSFIILCRFKLSLVFVVLGLIYFIVPYSLSFFGFHVVFQPSYRFLPCQLVDPIKSHRHRRHPLGVRQRVRKQSLVRLPSSTSHLRGVHRLSSSKPGTRGRRKRLTSF